jgi:hypothetical protein
MARIYILLVLLLFSISCTRSVETEATLSFQFEKVSQGPQSSSILPGYYPSMVIINIKYDNKNHIQEWKCPYENENISGYDISDCELPSGIAINKTIPSGGNRLVQVLLIYFNEQEQMQFFYSDKVVSFAGGTANVVVGDTGWNINTSGKEGRVSGRFTRGGSNASDLYGTVIGYYKPANGRPEMAVLKETIFAGWFDFMFLDDVYFTYKMQETNEVLISNKRLQDFNKTSAQITSENLKMLKVHVPAHYEVYKKEQKEIELADIDSVTGVNNFGVFGVASYDVALFDMTDTTYITPNANPGSFTVEFNKFINISEIGFEYSNSPASVTIIPTGLDDSASAINYATVATTSTAPTTYNSQVYVTPYNATDRLSMTIPLNITKYEKMIIGYNEYESSYFAQKDNYLLYFDITTNSIANGASGSAGINYPVPSGTPSPLKDGKLLAIAQDPVDEEGAWLQKATELAAFVNSVFVEGDNMFDGANSKRMYIASYNTTTCGTAGEDCLDLNYYSIGTDSAAPFYGPYRGSNYYSCSTTCSYSFSYQFGVTNFRSILFKVSHNSVDDRDIDCASLEASGYILEDLGTTTTMTAVPQANLANSELVLCPYTLDANSNKKYYDFGRLLYRN